MGLKFCQPHSEFIEILSTFSGRGTSVNRAYDWLGRIRIQFPYLFYQWQFGFY